MVMYVSPTTWLWTQFCPKKAWPSHLVYHVVPCELATRQRKFALFLNPIVGQLPFGQMVKLPLVKFSQTRSLFFFFFWTNLGETL